MNISNARIIRVPEIDWGLDLSIMVAVIFHGPLDVVLTTMAWESETNFVPLNVGLWPWVALKIGSIALVVAMWWWSREYDFDRDLTLFFLGMWSGLGLTVVVLNAISIGYLGVAWL